VNTEEVDDGKWTLRQLKGIEPFTSGVLDSERFWWRDRRVTGTLRSLFTLI